LIIEISIKRN